MLILELVTTLLTNLFPFGISAGPTRLVLGRRSRRACCDHPTAHADGADGAAEMVYHVTTKDAMPTESFRKCSLYGNLYLKPQRGHEQEVHRQK